MVKYNKDYGKIMKEYKMFSKEYKKGVDDFLDQAQAANKSSNLNLYYQCQKCMNKKLLDRDTIHVYIIINDMDATYIKSCWPYHYEDVEHVGPFECSNRGMISNTSCDINDEIGDLLCDVM